MWVLPRPWQLLWFVSMSSVWVYHRDAGEAGLGTAVVNTAIELALFMASDLIVRLYFRQSTQGQREMPRRDMQFKLLITQEVVVFVFLTLLLLLHHVPYVLMVAAIAVLARAFHLKLHVQNGATVNSYIRPVVSKPVRGGLSKQGYGPPSKQEGFNYSHSQQAAENSRLLRDNKMPTKPASNIPTSAEQEFGRKHLHQDHGSYLRSGLSYIKKPTSLLKSSYQPLRKCYAPPHSPMEPNSAPMEPNSAPMEPNSAPMEPNPPNTPLSQASEESSRIPARDSSQASVEHHSLATSASDVTQGIQLIPKSTTMLPYNLRSSVEGRSGNMFAPPSTTPPGLVNEGNTCFINSTLQCLNWTPGFIKLLPQFTGERSDTSLFLSKLNSVFLSCNQLPNGKSAYSPISTSALLSSISCLESRLVAPSNLPQYQQDTAEFLLWLLNYLHSTLRAQTEGQTGLHRALSEEEIEGKMREKRSCEDRINEIGSRDSLALQEPMSQLSELDWSLYWQGHSSTLYEIFMGQILEARECQNCRRVTVNTEYFTLLTLPIPVVKPGICLTLTQCFSRFSELEQLVKDNMITCSCASGSPSSLSPASRLALLSILPQCLIIQLTRFTYSNTLHTAVKKDTLVYFPLVIDLFPFTMKAKLNSGYKETKLYHLHGFCVHSGAQSTSFGHYVAYCKAVNKQWYHYNDDRVVHVKDIEGELESDFVLRNAYLLFYHLSP